jgi:uncharacterized membrane protein
VARSWRLNLWLIVVANPSRQFPVGAGLCLGVGLGGFFDGIVLHQLLQWHHMLSSWYPITTIENLRLNTLWDGIFHSATYLFVVIGLYKLWLAAETCRLHWSGRAMIGTILIGWGGFNMVEGVIDHAMLGVHHVNELRPRGEWWRWDIGFLAWGAAMLSIGSVLARHGPMRDAA